MYSDNRAVIMYWTCGHDEQTVNAQRLMARNGVKSGCMED
jgi:hypothetical protein